MKESDQNPTIAIRNAKKNTLKQTFQNYAPGWNFPDDLLKILPVVQCLKLKRKNSYKCTIVIQLVYNSDLSPVKLREIVWLNSLE